MITSLFLLKLFLVNFLIKELKAPAHLVFFRIYLLKKQSFTNVLQNMRSKKFRNLHRKTPMLESLFNKVAGFFYRTLRVATSTVLKIS